MILKNCKVCQSFLCGFAHTFCKALLILGLARNYHTFGFFSQPIAHRLRGLIKRSNPFRKCYLTHIIKNPPFIFCFRIVIKRILSVFVFLIQLNYYLLSINIKIYPTIFNVNISISFFCYSSIVSNNNKSCGELFIYAPKQRVNIFC